MQTDRDTLVMILLNATDFPGMDPSEILESIDDLLDVCAADLIVGQEEIDESAFLRLVERMTGAVRVWSKRDHLDRR